MGKQTKHIDENSSAQYVDWLRGEGVKPADEVIEHVASCFECKEELLELAEILDNEDRIVNQKRNKRINLNLIWRAAAVLLGVLVVALAIEFLRSDQKEEVLVNDQTEVNPVQNKDSQIFVNDTNKLDSVIMEPEIVIIIHDTIKYAENFKTNPGLEVLIDANFRSENSLTNKKNFRQQYLIGDTLHLDFSGFKHEEKIFSLISNRGKSIRDLTVQDMIDLPLIDLVPGLYYWKLVTSDEILILGSFNLFSRND